MRCRSHGDGEGGLSSRRRALKRIGQGTMAATGAALLRQQPALALFEDYQKKGGCPTYEQVKSATVDGFDVNRYMGVWYELAYHDWTQVSICGCTRFNMTLRGQHVEDMFTTKCPRRDGETYAINMTMTVNPAMPGRLYETAFYTEWPNMVVDVWRVPDADGGPDRYERAIQFQCVQLNDRKAFVGINFLSRRPIVAPGVLEEMWQHARQLGLAPYGGNPTEMVVVNHRDCVYPLTTDKNLIFRKEKASLGTPLGVQILDASLGVPYS
ncbi:unnamed protein product [Phaeothamnion confervicola]